MKFVVIIFLHSIAFVLLCTHEILADTIDCSFNENGISIYAGTGKVQRIPGYRCKIKKITQFETENSTNIQGNHIIGRNDHDVTIVSHNDRNIKNLTTFDSSFCEKFRNTAIIAIVNVKIAKIEENSLEKCANLNIFYLANNNLDEIPVKLLNRNGKLTRITIGDNPIKTLPENVFKNQINLEILWIYKTQINNLPQNIFQSLAKLQVLLLKDNQINILNPIWFENLINLNYLDLSGNQISEIEGTTFSNLKNLKELYLNGNRIKILEPNVFENLENLEVLGLSRNEISDLPENIFGSLKKLQKLNLNRNKLTEIRSKSFGVHSNLKKFLVAGNKINAFDEKLIEKFGVPEIDMEGNICSQEKIVDINEEKNKLKKCFDNYGEKFEPTSTATKESTTTTNTIKSEAVMEETSTKSTISTTDNIRISTSEDDVKECGKAKIFEGNIIGGSEIPVGAFPWIAVLIRNDEKFFCGGTLISNRKVLTAAHCIQGKSQLQGLSAGDFFVSLGVHNLSKLYELGRLSYAVQSVHIHPDWNTTALSYDADIAVLIFEDKVQFSRHIQPICLINPNSNFMLVNYGAVVGYGKSEDESKNHENIPRILDMPIYSNEDCFFENKELVTISSRRTFCGGYNNGSGVCKGDSGSGLVITDGNSYYLRGIVSSSLYRATYECDVHTYSVFTDISKYFDWINEVSADSYLYD